MYQMRDVYADDPSTACHAYDYATGRFDACGPNQTDTRECQKCAMEPIHLCRNMRCCRCGGAFRTAWRPVVENWV